MLGDARFQEGPFAVFAKDGLVLDLVMARFAVWESFHRLLIHFWQDRRGGTLGVWDRVCIYLVIRNQHHGRRLDL
jgi:hypothetical protein